MKRREIGSQAPYMIMWCAFGQMSEWAGVDDILVQKGKMHQRVALLLDD